MVILTAFEKPRSLQKNINKCRPFHLHAKRDSRLHDHFVIADRINVMRRDAFGFEQLKKMRGKPAGNGAFARNFPNDDVVSRVKNRLAVFEVTGAPIGKDKPVLFLRTRSQSKFIELVKSHFAPLLSC